MTGIREMPLLNITLEASFILKFSLATTNFVLIISETWSAQSFTTISKEVTIPTSLLFSTTG